MLDGVLWKKQKAGATREREHMTQGFGRAVVEKLPIEETK